MAISKNKFCKDCNETTWHTNNNRVIDCASNKFEQAYEIELRIVYQDFIINYKIVEETETQTMTYRSLKYIG
jgi:hypothetical protein